MKNQQVFTQEIKPTQPQVFNTPLPPTKLSIPIVSDDEYSDGEDSDDESVTGNNHHIDDPTPPRYNLRICATNVINSLILEETPDATSKITEPVHQGRFSIAAKLLQVNEMCTPFNMFAGAVIDEETGKAMEYCDLINSEKYHAVWSKAM
eukprot:13097289-Ditylum_brightwellii.AAC.1